MDYSYKRVPWGPEEIIPLKMSGIIIEIFDWLDERYREDFLSFIPYDIEELCLRCKAIKKRPHNFYYMFNIPAPYQYQFEFMGADNSEGVRKVFFEIKSTSKRFTSNEYAKIQGNGDLEVGASDTGDYPKKMMGGDYEYWVEVPVLYKDDLLLSLIEKCFKDEQNPVDAFRGFVKERGIPHEFNNWVWMDRD
jgi:hypothetical protein